MTEHIKQNVKYTRATLVIEGFRPSRKAIAIYKKTIKGKQSLTNTIKEIELYHGITRPPAK